MPDTATHRPRFTNWLIIFGLWTFAAVYFASQMVTQSRLSGKTLSFWTALSWELVSAYVWCALMPLILWLARRFPLEGTGRWRNSLYLFVAGFAVVFAQLALDALLLPPMGYMASRKFGSYGETYRAFLLVNIHLSLLLYWVVIGMSYAVSYYRRYRERELRASQLEARLAQTQLQVLRMQLHPHFLFNTLNAISELIYQDPEAAERMIADLSDLLRLSLETVGEQEVPLQQEVEFLKKYLEIEQTRFHDRLELELEIAPDTLDAQVPNMIFQPLVENAVRHGIAPNAAGGRVEIGAWRVNGSLHLRVKDNGRGLPENLKEGVGLANTRARLARLYGAGHQFTLHSAKGEGVTLDIKIPFHQARHEDTNLSSG